MTEISFKRHWPGRLCDINRAEHAHRVIRRREQKQRKFKSQGSAQRVIAVHTPIYHSFSVQPHLVGRSSLRHLPVAAHTVRLAAITAV